MVFAREIFIQIKNVIRFQQSEKEDDSHYTVLGNTLVRVSNHCTYMYVWENYFNIHPKQRGMKILSLVFEDNKDTFHPNCLATQHNNPKPIVVEEYVYPLHGNAQYLSKVDVNAIIKSLQNLGGTNRFHEPTGKAERYVRKSMNPTTQNIITDTNGMPTISSEFGYGADDVSESSTRKNMKKNVVKINENTLRQIVAESVKKVLKESMENYGTIENEDAQKWMSELRMKIQRIYEYFQQDFFEELSNIFTYAGIGDERWMDIKATADKISNLSRQLEDKLYIKEPNMD